MALYRFEAKVISRTGGRSSVASAAYQTGKCSTSAAAYRAAVKLKDERTGQQYDYSRKLGVEGAEIITPVNAPAWMQDREQLWNAVEKVEKRKDAQLARDFIISLPHELDQQQRAEVIRDFVREQFTARGYVADIAWHLPDQKGGLNFHAHVMVPMRKVEGDGFARTKERPPEGQHPAKAWNEELGRLREAWANTANRHLEAAGLDVRIDQRSLAARGIDREPEPKQGALATQIEQQGRRSLAGDERRAAQARNAERARLRGELAAVVAEEALAPPTQLDDPKEQKDQKARVWEQASLLIGVEPGKALRAPLEVMDAATGAVEKLADFVVDFFGGGSAPRPKKSPEIVSDEQGEARAAMALIGIHESLERGERLSASDIRSLTPAHLESIRAKGDDAVRQLVDDAREQAGRSLNGDWRDPDRERGPDREG